MKYREAANKRYIFRTVTDWHEPQQGYLMRCSKRARTVEAEWAGGSTLQSQTSSQCHLDWRKGQKTSCVGLQLPDTCLSKLHPNLCTPLRKDNKWFTVLSDNLCSNLMTWHKTCKCATVYGTFHQFGLLIKSVVLYAFILDTNHCPKEHVLHWLTYSDWTPPAWLCTPLEVSLHKNRNGI